MMIGFVVAFVATPTMTVGHLLFAGLGTAYVLVGVHLEERDLRATLPEYAAYAATTPQLIPRSTGRRPRQID
jgi:protein-S-isoprenylcysteine O-methyltransferase Ste14